MLSSGSSDETNEWEEVGHKNKSTITRVVRRMKFSKIELNVKSILQYLN